MGICSLDARYTEDNQVERNFGVSLDYLLKDEMDLLESSKVARALQI